MSCVRAVRGLAPVCGFQSLAVLSRRVSFSPRQVASDASFHSVSFSESDHPRVLITGTRAGDKWLLLWCTVYGVILFIKIVFFYDALRPKWMLYKPLDAMFPWLPHSEAWNVVSMATHHWWWDLIIFSVCFYFRRSGSAGSRAHQTAQVRLKCFQMILELHTEDPAPMTF